MPLVHLVVAPRAPSDRPPLLGLLHGIGADEADLLPLAEFFDPRFTVVSARAPHEAEPAGYRWYAIDWAVTPPRGDRVEISTSRDLLARFVAEATAAYGTDPSLVFLFGRAPPPRSAGPCHPRRQGQKAYEVLVPLLGARIAHRAFDGLGDGVSEDSLIEAARWLTARLDDGSRPRGSHVLGQR